MPHVKKREIACIKDLFQEVGRLSAPKSNAHYTPDCESPEMARFFACLVYYGIYCSPSNFKSNVVFLWLAGFLHHLQTSRGALVSQLCPPNSKSSALIKTNFLNIHGQQTLETSITRNMQSSDLVNSV